MIFFAPAKINLGLNVLAKRADGYHEVDMILQSISLADQLDMEVIPSGIELTTNKTDLPGNEQNLVYQAAEQLRKKYKVTQGIRIHLTKNIPLSAGLAGGSSDCAATLRGLNELWDLKLSVEELREIGSQIGSDVAFCISGGTARAKGRGELLTTLPDCPSFYVLLVKPRIGISTAVAYQHFEKNKIQNHPNINGLVHAIQKKDTESIRASIGNIFEEWIPEMYPEVDHILKELKKIGAKGVGMSGSGPTVFALADTLDEVIRWNEEIKLIGNTWVCKTINQNLLEGELAWLKREG